ncbi:MAG TPA: histidine kinase dimerization/phospho-acceptor domain-containing protein, partial [Desulfobacteria bacterium]|nr:histidine kinase dimerization/phospho-acceptor domain-containing protein [Desulfobacteria bacterium]
MKASIFSKKYIWLVLLIIIAGIVFSVSAFRFTRKSSQLELSTINRAKITTSLALKHIEQNFDRIDASDVVQILTRDARSMGSQIHVLDLSGKILFSSSPEQFNSAHVNPAEFLFYDNNYAQSHSGKYKISFPVMKDGKQMGNAVFEIPLAEELAQVLGTEVKRLIFAASLCVVLLLLAIIFLYYKIRWQYKLPLKQLEMASRELSKGNFDFSVKARVTEELGPVVMHFNQMKDELAYMFQKQSEYERARKELVATISHELRTPISSIKMYAEGLKSGLAEDFETVTSYVDVINAKADAL